MVANNIYLKYRDLRHTNYLGQHVNWFDYTNNSILIQINWKLFILWIVSYNVHLLIYAELLRICVALVNILVKFGKVSYVRYQYLQN